MYVMKVTPVSGIWEGNEMSLFEYGSLYDSIFLFSKSQSNSPNRAASQFTRQSAVQGDKEGEH